ncbi:YfaZ family protein, partial [Klebsiella pneumoniae]|uniref:YfaZ family protein n=1 Tax=Klebsiella pneumoniae TaxID=573 RepID=UPI001D956792
DVYKRKTNAGVRLNVLPSLNSEAGYRYIDMAGKDGNRDITLADGACARVTFRY